MQTEFSKDDVRQIKELLAKADNEHLAFVFNGDEIATLRRIIKTFDEHQSEIAVMIQKEQISKLRTELRLRGWSIIKWFLATFLLIVAAVQGWQAVIYPLFKWGSGK